MPETVFVPYRGIYFLYLCKKRCTESFRKVFVPYRGIYFLYPLRVVERRVRMMRFRPLSGNLLSLPMATEIFLNLRKSVFVPYRGIYFLYFTGGKSSILIRSGFRPLSGNLLSLRAGRRVAERTGEVFVPYRGIYFLYQPKEIMEDWVEYLFSSPIGESTFSTSLCHL